MEMQKKADAMVGYYIHLLRPTYLD
jgi:hypothetical protein